MNNLAMQALNRARHKLASPPTRPVEKISVQPTLPISTGVLVDGPINHFMFLEGRRHAIDLAGTLSALPGDEVIANLEQSSAGRPASYAAGIKSIVDAIKEQTRG